MSSILSRILSRIYPSPDSPPVTILGLDFSGKTSLLYFLKLGEIVQTISSIGLNVETVDVSLPSRGNKSGGKLTMTGWDIGTGCASPNQFYAILHHYIAFAKAIIWVVDSSDRERLAESAEMLGNVMKSIDSRDDVKGDKMKVPVLILAHKSDKPNAMSVEEVRAALTQATAGRLASIFKTRITQEGCSNPKLTGLPEAFDWLNTALEIVKASENTGKSIGLVQQDQGSPEKLPELFDQRAQNVLAQKLETWLGRSEDDMPDEEYLERFKAYTLPEWDHFTHVRVAYLILNKHGRQEGKNLIFKGIEDYITNSQQTKGRAFHTTMTYFWIQIVHLGIRNTPPLPPNLPSSASLSDFTRFLIVNPHVVDGNLWSDYYSKEVLMSPKAKLEMVLPDKKPLPNLVTRDAITSFGK